MAKIVINEISQNYTYTTGNNNYATVALPLTACWGPAYQDPESVGKKTVEEVLEETRWEHFPSTREGLEQFVSTYRGPASNYRLSKDFSYQIAMTLLTQGYDILTCRVCNGAQAQGQILIADGKNLNVKAKYPGTFGNNLRVVLYQLKNYSKPGTNYWNLVTYIVDSSGIQSAVENLTFVFDVENSSDSLLSVDEVTSNFVSLTPDEGVTDTAEYTEAAVTLTGGTDKMAQAPEGAEACITKAKEIATTRYEAAGIESDGCEYLGLFDDKLNTIEDTTRAETILNMEWIYTAAFNVYTNLEDKLAYNPQRIISPGWDDQNVNFLLGAPDEAYKFDQISPLHIQLMEVAYNSRCATAYIDVPKSLPRSKVWDSSTESPGYAQRLARYSQGMLEKNPTATADVNIPLYSSHSAFFAPWGQFTYTGTSRMQDAPPCFLALAIERAMILNQSIQYEWALPTTRSHSLNIGKMAYNVPKKLLDVWQNIEGVGVNVITDIPEMGVSLWGNSTLFEVPPATYQALANLSTRKLVNAVENLAFKCGVGITFRYNNNEAYSAFYAGVTPLLDTMRNVGAIEDYRVQMSADINGLEHVNANTVIGKIYLVVPGVINDIYVDLIALPSGTDLTAYAQ